MEGRDHGAARWIGWAATVFGIWLLIAGIGVRWRSRLATDWPTVEGTVLSAQLRDDDDYYFVDVQYRYRVDGRDYEGDRVALSVGFAGISVASEYLTGSADRSEAEAMLRGFEVGDHVVVHYDPRRPARAALEIPVEHGVGISICGGLLALVGAILVRAFASNASDGDGLETEGQGYQAAREQNSDPNSRTSSYLPESSQADVTTQETLAVDVGYGYPEFLRQIPYRMNAWRPGDLCQWERRADSFGMFKHRFSVDINWADQTLTVGSKGRIETLPLSAIRSVRMGGKYEVRQRNGGTNRPAQRYDAWDVTVDLIFEGRRVRIASDLDRRDPHTAYESAASLAYPLAKSLEVPVRWAGYEDHSEFQPAPQLAIETADPSDVTQRVARTAESYVPDQPLDSKITVRELGDGLSLRLPMTRWRVDEYLIFSLVTITVTGACAPFAFSRDALGPRIFVLFFFVPAFWILFQKLRWAVRSGEVGVDRQNLTIRSRGLLTGHTFQASIRNDVVSVGVLPTGQETDGQPMEELAVFSTSGAVERFFPERDSGELAWLAHQIRTAAGLPVPYVTTQADSDKAALEVSRSQMASSLDEMQSHLDDMRQAAHAISEREDEAAGRAGSDDVLHDMQRSIASAEKRLATGRLNATLAEFGLIDIHDWQPGERVAWSRTQPDRGQLRSAAFFSGLMAGIAWIFIAPFAVPILGAIIVVPFDLLGARRAHLVVADLMALGPMIVLWVVMLSVFSMVWCYLKLDASFAPRDVVIDWLKRELRLETRRQVLRIPLREIEQLCIRPIRRPGMRRLAARLEAVVPRREQRLVLLELCPNDEIEGVAPPTESHPEQMQRVADSLTNDLDVELVVAETTTDPFTADGLRPVPIWRDALPVWRAASNRARRLALGIALSAVVFWGALAIRAWQALGPTS